ncbi:hypothetical protein F4778DRAFT_777762 [Xylariomycetidae sp. FL2044]|nr:hypothetical protein F4778DRAFT_777762 [Xylariomycetidae sp. FL2044]
MAITFSLLWERTASTAIEHGPCVWPTFTAKTKHGLLQSYSAPETVWEGSRSVTPPRSLSTQPTHAPPTQETSNHILEATRPFFKDQLLEEQGLYRSNAGRTPPPTEKCISCVPRSLPRAWPVELGNLGPASLRPILDPGSGSGSSDSIGSSAPGGGEELLTSDRRPKQESLGDATRSTQELATRTSGQSVLNPGKAIEGAQLDDDCMAHLNWGDDAQDEDEEEEEEDEVDEYWSWDREAQRLVHVDDDGQLVFFPEEFD